MGAPLVIGISGGARDREVASALLRTILDDERPYERAALVGGRELFDGVEWSRHPDRASELQRIDVHLRHASEKDLAYAIVELDEAERGAVRADLLCVIGVGGAGTVTAADGRSLSFSARGSLADVGVGRTESHYGYVQFLAHTPSREMTLAVPLTGRFNLGPALAVVTVCELLGITAGQIGIGLLGARASGHGELLAAGPTEQVRGDESLEAVFLDLVEDPEHPSNTGQAARPTTGNARPNGRSHLKGMK